jgi:hypothetical protein
MVEEKMLHHEIITIAEDYFGPAAPRFINKIIESHLRKDPELVTKKDMPEIVTWVSLSVAMMTDERSVVAEFTKRLNMLTQTT